MSLIVLVGAPRSGAALLSLVLAQGEDWAVASGTLARAVDLVPRFTSVERGQVGERIGAAEATSELVAALRSLDSLEQIVVEWSPSTSLRVELMAEALPDATFVLVVRRPRLTVASSMVAWASHRFVSYPDLTDWQGDPWSFPLVDGWRELIGLPLAEVCAAQWEAITTSALDDLEGLPLDRWTVASFDDLLLTPANEVARITEGLGLNWSGSIPDPLPEMLTCVTPPGSTSWQQHAHEIEGALSSRQRTVSRLLATVQQRRP